MVIGNTPTPTNVPTPSPAQHAASLPTTTPQMNMASPAAFHHLGSTPQGLGISPADTHTPSHIESMQQSQMEAKNPELQAANQFVRMKMEEVKLQMQNTWLPQQAKNLSPEEKQHMQALLHNPQTLEYLKRLDKMAPIFYHLTRDEAKLTSFLRLVCLFPAITNL
jgi:hypothetical protein